MSTIGKFFAGLSAGYIAALVLGALFFQAELFKDGLLELGIGPWGCLYYFGGLFAGVALLAISPPSSMRFKIIAFYPLSFMVIVSIGLNGMLETGAGAAIDPVVMAQQMASAFAAFAFWVTPVVVIAGYAGLIFVFTESEPT